MAKKISVIIPVYNEEKVIRGFLKQLDKLDDLCEIILVDGGSTDATLTYIDPACKVLSGAKGRAAQMNLGAKYSSGDILFFLHCDSILPEHPAAQIREVMRDHEAGCFGIAFATRNIWMKCCQYLSNCRVRRSGIMFGDQGIFMNRSLFFEAGGFPELPIMEDYQLSLTLRERKTVIGMTEEKIWTSDRRFAQGGRLRVMWRMNRLRAMYRRGMDVNKIARIYRDIR